MSLAVDEARAGVRAWVRETGRRTGSALRTATPYGIVAFLAASAVAPVAAAALGAPADFGAALNQLGGMGSNFMSDTLMDTAKRLRGTNPSTEQWRDAVAAELLTRLEAGDERAAALSDEIAGLLHSVDAVGVALRAADQRHQKELGLAFAALGEDVGRLQILAVDAVEVLAEMREQLAGQGRALAVQTDMLRQGLVLAAQLQQEVRRRLPAAEPDEPAPLAYDGGSESPYPGLASFQSTDARHFYGREALVGELIGRLSEQLVGGPPLVVVGVSGAGKSSLLHAGVLPAIAGGGLGPDAAGWPWLLMTPGSAPLAELTARAAAIAGTDPDSVASFGALAALAGGDGRLVIVIDQFEELFTQCADPAERAAFAAALAAAAPALVLIAVRADFYPQCTELPAMVPMLGAGQVLLGPLGTDELRRAVRAPAADAGLTLEPGLEELLLTDLGALAGDTYEPGALPLLAHTLRATWARRTATTMTVAGYRATGGIRHAVADTAERIYIGLSGLDRDALRSALLALVTVVDDRTVRHRATPAEVNTGVLAPMIEARLVTAGRDSVQISHEALLTSWPRLANWLTEAREEILLRRRLAQAAADWSAARADPDALYRGVRLAAAREWAAGRTDVPEAQQRFLAAGAEAAEAEQLAQQRSARRLRRLVAGLAVVLLLAVAGGLVALDQRGQARVNGRDATSRQFAAESRTSFVTDQVSAVRKALAAWDTGHTMEARSALLSAQLTTTIGRLGTEKGAYTVAVSPDGRLVAVGYRDGRIQLWDSHTLRRVGAEFKHPAEQLIALRFSPDGRYLAGGALNANGLAIWDAPTGRLLQWLAGIGGVGWLPDSSAVLTTRALGSLAAWTPDGRLAGTVASPVPLAASLAISRDGAYVAAAGNSASEEVGGILRRRDQRQMVTIPGAAEVAFAADGTLVSLDVDGRVARWQPATGRKIATIPSPQYTVASGRSLAITPDGTVFAQSNGPGAILEMTLGGGPRSSLTSFPGAATGLGLSADGHLLAVVGIGSVPMLFRYGVDWLPHPQRVGYLAYDSTGARLATGSNDPVVRIWDPRTSNLISTIPLRGTGGPLGFAYARDGSLAVRLDDYTTQVFDAGGKLRGTLRLDQGQATGPAAFSPDGSLLAVVAIDPGPDDNRQDEPGLPDVVVYDARTLQPKARLETPGNVPLSLTFTPDGAHLVVAANHSRSTATDDVQDGSVWQWRATDLTDSAHTDLPRIGLQQLTVSPDSQFIALAASTGRAELLHVDGLTPAGSVGQHPVQLTAVAFAPDGRTVATASKSDVDVVRLWDTRSNTLVAELRGQANAITAVQFSPDGKTLATASSDWTVTLTTLDPDDAVRRLCAVAVPNARNDGEPVPALCR